MIVENVEIKPETRNHKGFFIPETSYKLMDIDRAGWALICMNNTVCHYVDPDNLKLPLELPTEAGLGKI